MKANKLDPAQPVELTIHPDYQSQPFVIAGNYEAVMPIAEQVQASDARRGARIARTRKLGHSAIEAPKRAVEGFVGRVGMNMKAVAFDKLHGTNLYDQLQEKREGERIVKMGVELGLISLTDTVCQRHAHAVDQLKP